MAGEDSWVFDSLVCFLHGPIWNAPLQTFIEEKSLSFDPNVQLKEGDENIRQLHDDYKSLVDYMLGSFMEEMQISPEQFEMACMESRQQQTDKTLHFHQRLFQQIWAANDINVFIQMMTKRNVELQLQVLDLIEKNQTGNLPNENEGDTTTVSHLPSENLEEKSMEEISTMNSVEKEMFNLEDNSSGAGDTSDRFERLNLFFDKNQVPVEELNSRQEYLREQRDKIIALKRQNRAKLLQENLNQMESENVSYSVSDTEANRRPNSAYLAQHLLKNPTEFPKLLTESINEPANNTPSTNKTNDKALALRKSLAKRLKDEVVDKN